MRVWEVKKETREGGGGGERVLSSERRALDFTITVGLPPLPLQVMTLL